ncbi:MAG TPA: hypothetical protein VMT45_03200 [Thermoanaerobaculaceae bacterium]|nr:hypothetical protein [Thermoanaerobaculaceae bacterium]
MNGMPSDRELVTFAILIWLSGAVLLGVVLTVMIRARRESTRRGSHAP